MRIALLGPADLDPLLPRLEVQADDRKRIPSGTGATPVAPLAAGLHDRGHEILLITLSARVPDELIVKGDRLQVRVGHYRHRHRARDGFAAERQYLKSVLDSEDCEVVHAHWSYEYALAALSSPHRTVITLHDWAPTVLRMHPDPYRAVRFLMSARVLASGRHFTVPSPYMQQKAERWIRRPVAVVPNGLSDEAFRERANGPRLEAPTLLAVNNGFQRRKNVTALLKAFAAVRHWNPRCVLQLVGHGFGPDGEAKRWAEARGLDSGVSFSGPLPAEGVAQAMADADLFVHPAREESFGMVLAEAMAQGLPVVAGRCSGAVPWILDDGKAGSLVDVANPSDIARHIIDLLTTPGRWLHFSQAGFHRISGMFRLLKVIDGYENSYVHALSE